MRGEPSSPTGRKSVNPAVYSVTAGELAGLIGVSPRSITDLAKRGIVYWADKGGGFDMSRSVRGYCEHLRKLAAGRGGEVAIATATAERARLAKEQADHIALKNARERGALLDARVVEREWSEILRNVRAGLLAVPSRAAQRLPHLNMHDVVEIDAQIRDVLAELGNGER